MHFNRSNLTGDGDEDQETPTSAEKETNQQMLHSEDETHLPLIKRRRRKIQSDTRRYKLLIENLLKRPMFQPDADPLSESEQPPQSAAVFDSETESDSDSEGHKESLVVAALPQTAEINQQLIASIPEEYKKLMNFMGGSSSANPNLVLEKRLKKGDVDERRNRLVIPQRKIRENFLEVEEEEKLNVDKWWTVEIIEPDCSVSLITLSKWETRKGPAYVLITEWNGLVERNELKEGDLMQLWSFRAAGAGGGGGDGEGGFGGRGRLCLMLLEIVGGDEEENESSALESSG